MNVFAVFHIFVLIHIANLTSSLASVRTRAPIPLHPGKPKPTRPDNIDGEKIVFDGRNEYESVQSEQFDRDPELADELFKEWQEAQENESRNMNVHQIPISTFRPNITVAEDRMSYKMPTSIPTIGSTKSSEAAASPSGFNSIEIFKINVVFLCILYSFSS